MESIGIRPQTPTGAYMPVRDTLKLLHFHLHSGTWPSSHLSQEPRDNFDTAYLVQQGKKG